AKQTSLPSLCCQVFSLSNEKKITQGESQWLTYMDACNLHHSQPMNVPITLRESQCPIMIISLCSLHQPKATTNLFFFFLSLWNFLFYTFHVNKSTHMTFCVCPLPIS
ncbi:mCG144934, partial [Mus musculus]